MAAPTPSDVHAPAAGRARPAAAFLDHLFPAPRDFAVRVGGEEALPATGEPAFTLALRSPEAVRRTFRVPVEESLIGAFLRGDLSIEGDIARAAHVVDAVRSRVRSPRDVLALLRLWRALPSADGGASRDPTPARLADDRRHTRESDRAAVQHHYDLGNDFYALFLDPRMVYSCAYFPDGDEDLATAQERKLEHVCRKLRLREGHSLLDVGCGWGGMLIYAAERHGVRGLGVTLSERQRELAERRVAEAGLADRIRIRLLDYRDLPAETFDRVVSIGMFEHVGRARMPEYFAKLRDALRPGGLLLNHGISRAATAPRRSLTSLLTDPLNRLIVGHERLTGAVFPDTELVPLSEVNLMGERAGLEVRDVENLREHYARTLRHWIARLEEREEEAARLVGEATVRAWRLYFAASAYRFDVARINVCQTLFARPDDGGRAEVPPSREDVYA